MPGPSSNRYRVTVVGGGVAGAATAFALARKGALVTLIDLDQLREHPQFFELSNIACDSRCWWSMSGS